MGEYQKVEVLKGKILTSVTHIKGSDERIEFVTNDGNTYWMLHYQDCCESVGVEDVIGELDDLVGAPIVMAEEVTWGPEAGSNSTGPITRDYNSDGSYTWTFYKFATIKGYVTIRWYGSSNGYYSESVSFERMD